MKVIGIRMLDDKKVPMIVECTSMEVAGHGGYSEKFDPNDCRILMHTTHPTVSYFIIKTERGQKKVCNIRPYKWLTKTEAEEIMKLAAESDVIDLRKLGNYQICSENKYQSVMVMNDINDWDDEYEPLLVKVVKDD